MAITMACPGCGAVLAVGDDAAGKLTRCPACKQVSKVETPPPAPAPRPVRQYVPSDPEPDLGPTPRLTKKPKSVRKRTPRASGTPVGLLIGLGVGLLVIGGAVAGIVIVSRSSKAPSAGEGGLLGQTRGGNTAGGQAPTPVGSGGRTEAPGAPATRPMGMSLPATPAPPAAARPVLPEGWTDYTAPDGSYRIFLPGRPTAELGSVRLNWYPAFAQALVAEVDMRPGQRYACALVVATIPAERRADPAKLVADVQGRLLGWLELPLGDRITQRDVTWAGRPAVEVITGHDNEALARVGGGRTSMIRVIRLMVSGERLYVFWVTTPGDRPLLAADRNIPVFFDSLELLK